MTGLELLKQHPKSRNIVIDWFMKEMVQSFKNKNVPSEFKEFMLEKGVNDDKVGDLIDLNPRMLFDVFDENNVIIVIGYHENIGFQFNVNFSDPSKGYLKRKEAEKEAVIEAFSILEKL